MKLRVLSILLPIVILLNSCVITDGFLQSSEGQPAYETVNGNIPEFTDEEITDVSFESYVSLDALGRCGVATACIGQDIMPTEERESIGQVKPSGWQIAKYDIVDGKYLYNRCHLIGFQLTGENANVNNLITGTRFMNVKGMLPFENEVAEYVKSTGNHVMYRVTPVFEGDNLLASGVKMEAYSVEDMGRGVSFNVYVYNIQPGVEIDYKDGSSKLISDTSDGTNDEKVHYILNIKSKRIHYPECSSVMDINPQNSERFYGTKEELLNMGYVSCGNCKP